MNVSDTEILLAKEAGKQPFERRMIAAGQAVLKIEGYSPGEIDGYTGPKTKAAFAKFKASVAGKPHPKNLTTFTKSTATVYVPPRRDLKKFYGAAGTRDCTAGKVNTPFPLVVAWNKDQTLRRFSCHKKVASNLQRAFEELLEHYGLDEIKRLGIDQYGGCYNYRKMRGGRSLSMHSWGIALDLHPNENRLKWRADRAAFARPEYDALHAIMRKYGFVNLGKEKGYDFMHFQAVHVK